MGQYEYPNLLTGSRSGEGWTRYGSGAGGGYSAGTGIVLSNSKTTEDFLFSPQVILHKNTDYTLHCFAANTANMSSTELWVLDCEGLSDSYYWIGAHAMYKNPGPGGRGSMPRSGSMRRRGTACHSRSASTTTGARTAKAASSGSATSCSLRARSRMHGHRQKGRCGRR